MYQNKEDLKKVFKKTIQEKLQNYTDVTNTKFPLMHLPIYYEKKLGMTIITNQIIKSYAIGRT